MLELGHFREIEMLDLHGGYNHVEGFLTAGADWRAHGCDIRKHVDETLVEAEIPNSVADFAILDEEGSIPRHAGQDFFVRIDFANVPEAGD